MYALLERLFVVDSINQADAVLHSVRINLEWLLSTQVSSASAMYMHGNQARRPSDVLSVLDYGVKMPGKEHVKKSVAQRVAQDFRQRIIAFEPRLIPDETLEVNIVTKDAKSEYWSIELEIGGVVRASPHRMPIRWIGATDSQLCAFKLRPQGSR